MIPMIFRLKVKSDDASFGLYFPLLLFYILAVPLFIIAAVVYILMMLAPARTRESRRGMMFLFKSPRLLTAAKGMEIEVHSKDADVIMFLK